MRGEETACTRLTLKITRGNITSTCQYLFTHPIGDRLTRALREGAAEGSIAAEAALMDQLLDTDGLSGSDGLLVAADEVVDA